MVTKNQQLESELTSWIIASNRQTVEQLMQPSVASVTPTMASSSGIMQQVQCSPLQFPSTTQTAIGTFGIGTPQQILPQVGELQQGPRMTPNVPSQRRVSFGSSFAGGSSGVNGNGNGDNNDGQDETGFGDMMDGGTQQQPQSGTTFRLEIKPKEPPIFYGRATEDVSTWISKVADFFYLTGATDHQQVAYVATLL